MERSARREIRNPMLALPGVVRLREQPPEVRAELVAALAEIVADARGRAQVSWKQNKGPMAAYWKAVGAYAEHLRRVLKEPTR